VHWKIRRRRINHPSDYHTMIINGQNLKKAIKASKWQFGLAVVVAVSSSQTNPSRWGEKEEVFPRYPQAL